MSKQSSIITQYLDSMKSRIEIEQKYQAATRLNILKNIFTEANLPVAINISSFEHIIDLIYEN